jgi:hypothetical protein
MSEEISMGSNEPGHLPPGAYVQCVDVLEMITDYLEGALPAARAKLIDEHLSVCDGCETILDQWKAVIRLSGHVTTDDLDTLDSSTRDRLLDSFRKEHPA